MTPLEDIAPPLSVTDDVILMGYIHNMTLSPGYLIVLLKIGDRYETAVISECDLHEMQKCGILFDNDPDRIYNRAFIKFTQARIQEEP